MLVSSWHAYAALVREHAEERPSGVLKSLWQAVLLPD